MIAANNPQILVTSLEYDKHAWIDADSCDIAAEIAEQLDGEEWFISDHADFVTCKRDDLETIQNKGEFVAEHGNAAIIYIESGIGAIDEFNDHFVGAYDEIEDYAYELVKESGVLDRMGKEMEYYFDYTKMARDIEIEHYTDRRDGMVYIFRY